MEGKRCKKEKPKNKELVNKEIGEKLFRVKYTAYTHTNLFVFK